ncbi:MAG: DMT family transporter [Verrucomicrobia bacterium]|nr:DMT family transporter [Verrucomicrobiota bacterium]
MQTAPPPPSRDSAKAVACGLAAVALWATVGSAFKLTLRHATPIQLLFYAALVSAVLLVVILACRGEIGHLIAGSPESWRRAALLGLVNPVAYYLLLFAAYDRLPAQEALALNYSWPLMLMLLGSVVQRQWPGGRDIVAGSICYAGIWCVATRGDVFSLRFGDPLGVGLALASTVAWAVSWIAGRSDPRPPVVALSQNFLIAVPVLAVVVAVKGGGFVVDGYALMGSAYVGAFEMGVTFVLWLLALRYATNPAAVGNLSFLSPVASLFLIHLVVGEPLKTSTLAGLPLILAGLVIQNWKGRRGRG